MNKLKKIFYTAGFHILSMGAFADNYIQDINCSSINIESLCRMLSIITLPIAAIGAAVGVVMQAPQLICRNLDFI